MTKTRAPLTRRYFLGATAVLPAAAALAACDSAVGPSDASVAADATRAVDASAPDGYVPDFDASSPQDASVPLDAPEPEPTCGPLPRIDLVRDCGAVGDGTTDDTDAFQRAAAMIQAAGGGELTIPAGTYLVGRQTTKPPGTSGPYYRPEPIFTVQDLSCLKVSGYGATMRLAPGLHYGAFDPTTGAAVAGPIRTSDTAAHVGRMFEISTSTGVVIEGLELDGNSAQLVLGGQWGNVSRQTSAAGIWLNRCTDVLVQDVWTHHHGLDGITVLHRGGPPPRRMPHTLLRVVSEHNGRQGLSWIGGWGLEATDCKFNHTGRVINRGGGEDDGVPLASLPGAGFDIEPNARTPEIAREGLFTRCEFIDNVGAGMVAAEGDGGYTTFVDCTFWGTTSYSIWANRPGLKFRGCRIYGSAFHAHDGRTTDGGAPDPELAALFEDCDFEDREWTDGNVTRRNNLYNVNDGSEGATWRRCTFTNHRVRSVNIGNPDARERFEECAFVFSNAALSANTYQARFQGSAIVSCAFRESPEIADGTRRYYIDVEGVVVLAPAAGDSPTTVEGPRVRWQSIDGPIGVIAPGTYG